MRRSILIVLMGCGAVLAASPAAAEQYPGWYGGVDLGYNALISRQILISGAECVRRGGRVGPRRDARGPYCTIPGLSLPATAPGGGENRLLTGIAWALSDRLSVEFAAACARERGQVATSGEYGFCRLPATVRR